MTSSACGCKCGGASASATGEVVRREPLLDVESLSESDARLKALAERAADRMIKFTVRGLLILLGVYLFDSMKRFAVYYTGENAWFSTFAVIVVAVPMAEVLCILGQSITAPPEK